MNHINALFMTLKLTYNSSSNNRVHEIEYGFKCVTSALEFIYSIVLNMIKTMKIEITFIEAVRC